MPHPATRTPRLVILLGFIALAVLHHDFWYWNDGRLIFGFMPVGLAYHAAFSVVTSLLWLAAVKWAWPQEVLDQAQVG